MPTSTIVVFWKGGRKNGKCGWVYSTPSIHSLLNIGVQLFKYAHLQTFHAVCEVDAQETPCLLLRVDIKIKEEDCTIFYLLEGKVSHIGLALKYIDGCKADEYVGNWLGGDRIDIEQKLMIFWVLYYLHYCFRWNVCMTCNPVLNPGQMSGHRVQIKFCKNRMILC